MFTAVRWMRRVACLIRLHDLILEIKTFVEGKKDISQLGNEEWVVDLAFMVDITTHFSSLNLTLQGNNTLCYDLYRTASAFVKKLFSNAFEPQNQ